MNDYFRNNFRLRVADKEEKADFKVLWRNMPIESQIKREARVQSLIDKHQTWVDEHNKNKPVGKSVA